MCGNLKNRSEILSLLQALPMAIHADHDEVMGLMEAHSLMGKGVGYIDALACFGPLDWQTSRYGLWIGNLTRLLQN